MIPALTADKDATLVSDKTRSAALFIQLGALENVCQDWSEPRLLGVAIHQENKRKRGEGRKGIEREME